MLANNKTKKHTMNTPTNNAILFVALKTKNQSKVNKCVRALLAYNKSNDERDMLYNEDKNTNAMDRKCENLFDKYLTYADELPKYELKRIEALYY
jgi:hypothetical protein